jgi:hypothetical protein
MKATTALCACLLLGGASTAYAIPVVLVVPSGVSAVVGDSVGLSVQVSGLDGEYIGAYDLSFAWDDSLVSLTSVAFGPYLDGPADSLSGADIGVNSLSIFEVSLSALANQTGFGSFDLFLLNFLTLAPGAASILPTGGILSNEFGEAYASFGLGGSTISLVSPTPVPEPASLGLLLFGVAALLGTGLPRRRRLREVYPLERAETH